jgi:hypothetical protein
MTSFFSVMVDQFFLEAISEKYLGIQVFQPLKGLIPFQYFTEKRFEKFLSLRFDRTFK